MSIVIVGIDLARTLAAWRGCMRRGGSFCGARRRRSSSAGLGAASLPWRPAAALTTWGGFLRRRGTKCG